MDSRSQIETAKAYDVNLEFDELNFLTKDPSVAARIFKDGYSDAENKYVEEAMNAFGADLATYLIKGALKDDGTVTQKDLIDAQ